MDPLSQGHRSHFLCGCKNFNLLKELKLDYYGDLSGGRFVTSIPKNAKRCSYGSGFKLL